MDTISTTSSTPPAYLQDSLQSEAELGLMLDLQLKLVWPLEHPLLAAHFAASARSDVRCLDVGCGQGGFALALAKSFPRAAVHGVDLESSNIEAARRSARSLPDEIARRVSFAEANAYELSIPAGSYDVACCRSMLYTLPTPERIVAQILGALDPSGGVAHFLCEDYGAVFAHPTAEGLDHERFWREGPCALFPEPHIGRKIHTIAARCARELGLRAMVRTMQLPVSTSPPAVPLALSESETRETLARVFETWVDYAPLVGSSTAVTAAQARAHLTDISRACRDPEGHVLWLCTVCEVTLNGAL